MPARRGPSVCPRPGQPLRVGTHNLGGARPSSPAQMHKLHAAVILWAQLRLDVVCLQETHHSCFGDRPLFERRLQAASARLHGPGWTVVSYRYASVADPASGVAILVRSDLLASGRLRRTVPLTPAAAAATTGSPTQPEPSCCRTHADMPMALSPEPS